MTAAGLDDALAASTTASLLADMPQRPWPTYDELSYEDFLREHLRPNKPFLLSAAATATWPARKHWAQQGDATSLPNLDALETYGDQIVPVADTAQREFSEFSRDERPLSEVLELWRQGEGRTLYVKDWHLVAELEERGRGGREVYSPPPCFRDDWLSPPFDAPVSRGKTASTADFRFVYAGPPGTFTPLHRDVYGSYSWSANVVGRKVWWLFPPGTEEELRDRRGELHFDVRAVEGAEALGVTILQQEGEIIFVPSGWHHQVVNVDFCISINHNFFASPTLARVYDALRASQQRCAESILDVKGDIRKRLGDARTENGTLEWELEWAEEVEGLLARDAGWGWEGFWECILENVQTPSAEPSLSPTLTERDEFVRAVIERYKSSPEWTLLPEARSTIQTIEEHLRPSA